MIRSKQKEMQQKRNDFEIKRYEQFCKLFNISFTDVNNFNLYKEIVERLEKK